MSTLLVVPDAATLIAVGVPELTAEVICRIWDGEFWPPVCTTTGPVTAFGGTVTVKDVDVADEDETVVGTLDQALSEQKGSR